MDLSGEPETSTRNCSDKLLALAGVADSPPCGVDSACQGRIGYASAVPNHLYELVLADHAMAMADKMNKEVEYLRLDMSDRTAAAQLSASKIEFAATGDEDHLSAS